MQPSAPYGGDQPHRQYDAGAAGGHAAGRRIRLGDLLVLIGGLFVFLFSFAPFVTYPDRAINDIVGSGEITFDGWFMAWSTQMFMAPLTWWVIFAALGLVALAIVRTMTGRDPELLRLRVSQFQVGLGLFAFFVLLGYALSQKQISFGFDKVISGDIPEYELYRPFFGWGGYLMLIGALVAAVGAVLNHFDIGPAFAVPTSAPAAQQRPSNGPDYPAGMPGQAGPFSAAGQVQYQQPGGPTPGPVEYQQPGAPAPAPVQYQQPSAPAPTPVEYQQGHPQSPTSAPPTQQ
jgi:hypothetical protein